MRLAEASPGFLFRLLAVLLLGRPAPCWADPISCDSLMRLAGLDAADGAAALDGSSAVVLPETLACVTQRGAPGWLISWAEGQTHKTTASAHHEEVLEACRVRILDTWHPPIIGSRDPLAVSFEVANGTDDRMTLSADRSLALETRTASGKTKDEYRPMAVDDIASDIGRAFEQARQQLWESTFVVKVMSTTNTSVEAEATATDNQGWSGTATGTSEATAETTTTYVDDGNPVRQRAYAEGLARLQRQRQDAENEARSRLLSTVSIPPGGSIETSAFFPVYRLSADTPLVLRVACPGGDVQVRVPVP